MSGLLMRQKAATLAVAAIAAFAIGSAVVFSGAPTKAPSPPAATAQATPDAAAAPTEPEAASGTTFVVASNAGAYRIVLKAEPDKVPLRVFHTWRLRLTDAQGQVIQPTTFQMRGGMPGHGHGMPSDPQLLPTNVAGDYVIEGVKFNMAGAWVFEFGIMGPAGWDTALVTFRVDP